MKRINTELLWENLVGLLAPILLVAIVVFIVWKHNYCTIKSVPNNAKIFMDKIEKEEDKFFADELQNKLTDKTELKKIKKRLLKKPTNIKVSFSDGVDLREYKEIQAKRKQYIIEERNRIRKTTLGTRRKTEKNSGTRRKEKT